MPTVIHDGILINPQSIETGFQPNHGVELTTESILQSMKELDDRPEMDELFSLILQSTKYTRGNQDA